MPSRVFTRKQVLDALSDAAVRQEQSAIPDFIYLFLRDVFYAVDVDGDGYVTADAVENSLPSLSFAKATTTSSSGATATPVSPKDIRCCNEAHRSFMTPGVPQTWSSPTSFTTLRHADHALRPLDLCGFMQTYWPLVSDKMARLVDETWSQQSSGSESDTEHEVGGSEGKDSRVRHTSRRTNFSPSPFRGLSMSPPHAETESIAADVFHSASTSTTPHYSTGTDIGWEQQRLYQVAVNQLWGKTHDTPLVSSRRPSLFTPIPLPQQHDFSPFAPPQRLLSDEEVEQLQIAFSFLDKNGSGFISSSEVAEVLQSLLDRAAACSRERGSSAAGCGVRSDVKDAAAAMLRLALSSTMRSIEAAAGGGARVDCVPLPRLSSPSSSVSTDGRCVSLPAFIRSFQCDSGAFPAELVAWCVNCSAALRGEGSTSLSSLQYSPRLAHSIQWMSPLECALVQRTLARYAEHISACLSGAKDKAAVTKSDNKGSGDGKTFVAHSGKGTSSGLSQRPTVNVRGAASSVRSPASKSPGCDAALSRNVVSVNETGIERIAQWCSCLRSSSCFSSPSGPTVNSEGSVTGAAVLPLTVLQASLLSDARNALFSDIFDFSVAEGTAAEAVLWNHVEAVCSLARRSAAVEVPPSSPEEMSLKAEGHGTTAAASASCTEAPLTLVDVERLAEVILTDPRYLNLEVLVPLSTRLEAVVDAAQRLPRRCVEQAVQAVGDHLLSYHRNRTSAEGQHRTAPASALTHLLELRRRLMTISPPLARLITGATRFVDGTLTLHDCLAVLSTQTLSVPPPRWPAVRPVSTTRPGVATSQSPTEQTRMLPASEMCAALLEHGDILKASRGWLRYACRRLLPQERQDILSALRHNIEAHLYETACVVVAARASPAQRAQPQCLHDDYAVFFERVYSSCWTCRVDLVVAAHVALILLASACAAPEKVMLEEAQWWRHVESSLEEWVGGQQAAEQGSAEERCTVDTWAMAAFSSTSAEIGVAACRSISRNLCQLRSEAHGFSHSVVVKEEALTFVLRSIIECESLWACSSPPIAAALTAHDACTRLVNTLVGCCPSRAGALVDITQLLRRWLEVYPLPLPAKYLSLCCPVEEVESVYYTLKRLAASEASQRCRSESPRSRVAAVRWAGDAHGNAETPATAAQPVVPRPAAVKVVTGITPICLAELLQNDAVLAALYAVSPPRALGLWSGSLCHLETVLRPLLLSATGVRVSLCKLHEVLVTADEKAAEFRSSAAAKGKQLSSTTSSIGGGALMESTCSRWSNQDVLVAMAIPPVVQHAMMQLFHLVDADRTGVVTEDQLRSYRPHVPATARYGWHRFVTMLCCSSMTSSPTSRAGGFSIGVLHSHCWRRRGVSKEQDDAERETSVSSVATRRTDDAAATYTFGDLFARVGELRACVQAQLLEEKKDERKTISSPVESRDGGTGLAKAAAASKASAAGTAQWWSIYLEVLCRSFSALA
ncbi:hypothetical protein ABB37_00388 [Leptomonas pyrrhocoris]|uniref:EF-hand domain-containing protein n=1 Tax=Leptomonas pyrrhocoris TaxID=157538 RepID=A0A0N0E078_LEPPY|nr:hypothetical protein ABB37_00388 [Leptomonas pyrrhocoris]KPA86135.1 hypothetical protein ABB37_00388 [Leptomonas pyrrhocoris]|eukprot:XP_015664574.1 hypothetical protein ABB37_00388 [Leptomonas pyrrhocoris]